MFAVRTPVLDLLGDEYFKMVHLIAWSEAVEAASFHETTQLCKKERERELGWMSGLILTWPTGHFGSSVCFTMLEEFETWLVLCYVAGIATGWVLSRWIPARGAVVEFQSSPVELSAVCRWKQQRYGGQRAA